MKPRFVVRDEDFGATVYDTELLSYAFVNGDQRAELKALLAEKPVETEDMTSRPSMDGEEDISDGLFDRLVAEVKQGTSVSVRRSPAPLPTDCLAAPIRLYFEITRKCYARCNYA